MVVTEDMLFNDMFVPHNDVVYDLSALDVGYQPHTVNMCGPRTGGSFTVRRSPASTPSYTVCVSNDCSATYMPGLNIDSVNSFDGSRIILNRYKIDDDHSIRYGIENWGRLLQGRKCGKLWRWSVKEHQVSIVNEQFWIRTYTRVNGEIYAMELIVTYYDTQRNEHFKFILAHVQSGSGMNCYDVYFHFPVLGIRIWDCVTITHIVSDERFVIKHNEISKNWGQMFERKVPVLRPDANYTEVDPWFPSIPIKESIVRRIFFRHVKCE